MTTHRAAMSVPADLIDAVKPLAERDGMTVASWIRRAAWGEVGRHAETYCVQTTAVSVDRLRAELRYLRIKGALS